jgi:hypothetical protein
MLRGRSPENYISKNFPQTFVMFNSSPVILPVSAYVALLNCFNDGVQKTVLSKWYADLELSGGRIGDVHPISEAIDNSTRSECRDLHKQAVEYEKNWDYVVVSANPKIEVVEATEDQFFLYKEQKTNAGIYTLGFPTWNFAQLSAVELVVQLVERFANHTNYPVDKVKVLLDLFKLVNNTPIDDAYYDAHTMDMSKFRDKHLTQKSTNCLTALKLYAMVHLPFKERTIFLESYHINAEDAFKLDTGESKQTLKMVLDYCIRSPDPAWAHFLVDCFLDDQNTAIHIHRTLEKGLASALDPLAPPKYVLARLFYLMIFEELVSDPTRRAAYEAKQKVSLESLESKIHKARQGLIKQFRTHDIPAYFNDLDPIVMEYVNSNFTAQKSTGGKEVVPIDLESKENGINCTL